ncbi:chaperonin 10-like protein [Gautieria morchelliformis]|nr:chaperonin 10-like protein [Gautieria morchelliformis]
MSSTDTMNALYYTAPRKFEVRAVPIPQVQDHQVLMKVSCCGICGTDSHLHDGEFVAKFPLIPGHEVIGVIAQVGLQVKHLFEGDRCVADPIVACENCFFCQKGQLHLCDNWGARGVTLPGAFAEYIVFDAKSVYKIQNLTDEEATLVEPTSCAIHGMDQLNTPAGAEVLVIGAGPTGLVLAQLLKLNGAVKVVIAANKGVKTQIAKEIKAGDEYIELDRESPGPQWERLKKDYPYGFDVVVEATGSEKIVNDCINYVRKGGALLIYSLYAKNAMVHWSPGKIFQDEIRIISSFAQSRCFPRAVAYLESGKITVKGMVTDVFTISDYQKALDKMNSRAALKIAVKPC